MIKRFSIQRYTFKMSSNNFGTSCDLGASYRTNKLIYPAANRNKEPILQIFNKYIPKDVKLNLLEISSGSGQHLAHFAPSFSNVSFQPSEFEQDLLGSITIYAEECPTKNIKRPLLIDICKDLSSYGFVKDSIDIIYNANMMHISPYECTIGLFKNAGSYLKSKGMMITYGPYGMNGVITPESNVNFNLSLKSQDSRWGIRDIKDLSTLARENNLLLKEIEDMPSNNKCLIWVKEKDN